MPEPTRADRVVVVTHTGELGGAEGALLRVLRAIDSGHFDVRAILLNDGPLAHELEKVGVPTTIVDGGPVTRVTRAQAGAFPLARVREVLTAVRKLRASLRQHEPDLVVANSLKSAVLMAIVAPMTSTPWVWHLHDRVANDYLPWPAVCALRLLARCGPRFIIANSEATAQTTRAPRNRIAVAYPGLERSAFSSPRGRRRSGRIGIIGRVSSTKGQREFLTAAEMISVDRPRTRFAIIGAALFEDGPVEEELRARCAVSPIADSVWWAGWVAEPAGQLRRLRILVHASPIPEPFGQVVAEAMAARVPVIATDGGGVPEILDPEGIAVEIADGVRCAPSGLLVRPADIDALAHGIHWMLDHPAEVDQMRHHARRDAEERFTIEQTVRTVSAIWRTASRPRRKSLTRGTPMVRRD